MGVVGRGKEGVLKLRGAVGEGECEPIASDRAKEGAGERSGWRVGE